MEQNPDIYLAAALRLLDEAKAQGFVFERIAPGEDGPLLGQRASDEWDDIIYIGDFWERCTASRSRRSSLVVPPGVSLAVTRVSGDAITVLHTVVEDWAL